MKNSFKDCRKFSKFPSICTPLIHIKGSTRWILTLIALLGICSICTSLTTAQVVLPHSVVGSGAATIIQPNVVHRSTIGQSLIGRISATELQHNIGFWYTAAESIRGNGGAVLSLPVMDAHLDDIISVPLVLVSSSALLTGTEQFRASIRFNKTILQPLDATGNVVYQGDDAILTVSGVIGKASGILSTMRFKVCMGNAAQTPLKFDSISLGTKNAYKIVRKDGEVTILDLCEAGDTTRLIKRSTITSLVVRPQPVTNQATIDILLGESGSTILKLVDIQGRDVSTLFKEHKTKGFYTNTFNVEMISSGLYFLVLQTPNELVVQQVLIQR